MGKYDDIINLPHHVSSVHLPMSRADRAAQFSAFKALTGLEEDLQETARVTEARPELSGQELFLLNEKFAELMAGVPGFGEESGEKKEPFIGVRAFVPDERKAGGSYETVTGKVKRVDSFRRKLIFSDRTEIAIDDIVALWELPKEEEM